MQTRTAHKRSPNLVPKSWSARWTKRGLSPAAPSPSRATCY